MNHVQCNCGAVFTENPIVALLEHREAAHRPRPVVYVIKGRDMSNEGLIEWRVVA